MAVDHRRRFLLVLARLFGFEVLAHLARGKKCAKFEENEFLMNCEFFCIKSEDFGK
jgi:hypothetical protein